MDMPNHRFAELFSQLGLDSDEIGINEFFEARTPLAGNIRLADAPFWSASQATFLREKILDDAEWAGVVDQLNAAVRAARNEHTCSN